MPQPLTIREALESDYSELSALLARVQSRYTATPEELRTQARWQREHPARPHFLEVVALQGQQLVAAFTLWQNAWRFQAQRYEALLVVHPDQQGRGLGRQLAHEALEHLRARGAREVMAGAYADQGRGLNFLRRQGFAERGRFLDNVLDLTAWHPGQWAAPLLSGGVRVLSLPQFISESGEDLAWQAFHTAFLEVQPDVPSDVPPAPTPYSAFRSRSEQTGYLPDGVFLAVSAQRQVMAFTELRLKQGDQTRLNTGLTGTCRAYRGQHLARAVKLAAIRYAWQRGVTSIETANASQNAGMLTLNAQLGFMVQRTWIEMRRELP